MSPVRGKAALSQLALSDMSIEVQEPKGLCQPNHTQGAPQGGVSQVPLDYSAALIRIPRRHPYGLKLYPWINLSKCRDFTPLAAQICTSVARNMVSDSEQTTGWTLRMDRRTRSGIYSASRHDARSVMRMDVLWHLNLIKAGMRDLKTGTLLEISYSDRTPESVSSRRY